MPRSPRNKGGGRRRNGLTAAAGGTAVGRDVKRSVVIHGDENLVVVDAGSLLGQIRSTSELPPEELRRAAERFLTYVVDRYRFLEFKGMGVADRVPLRIPLTEMYVPLTARLELPGRDTWGEGATVAGRKADERLSRPTAVLDLVQQHHGLIILGDPGAGKTTLLKYLALRLAQGEGDNLGLGPRLPVLAPLSAYAAALEERDVPLIDFIATHYRERGVDLPIDSLLREALEAGRALVLLDGLDEVRDLARRHVVVNRVVDFFALHRPAGNKFVLTSRIIGYRDVRPVIEGLVECTLVDFVEDDVVQFVEKWTQAVERAARGGTMVAAGEAQREREELLRAIRQNPGVRTLAANPLLLTILALMKRQGVTLPERRVELYAKYVEILLKHWNLARGLGRPPSRDLDVVETLKVLAPLALWMHETSPGVGLVKGEPLRARLEEILATRGSAEPEAAARQMRDDLREHAGLLLERGAGEYGFIHLTFQEYLAAVGLAMQGQRDTTRIVDVLAAHLGEPTWREVSLLVVGYLGIVQGRDEAASAVVDDLMSRAPGEPGAAVALCGDAVADAYPGCVTPACRQRVVSAVLGAIRDDEHVRPVIRAKAGDALARLGDPRFRPDAWYLPDEPLLGFVEIPAGPFRMGSDRKRDREAFDDEVPLREVDLPRCFISRYPVTVAQFRAFLAAKDDAPKDADSLRGPSNHPVVRISWHEVLAYTHWLTRVLREWPKAPEPLASLLRAGEKGLPWQITLPSEAEWEKAARGTKGWIFPWGDDPDPNRANYDDTGIGTTSAVGCFRGGASPYGIEEMSGNVWEWTRSLWGERSYAPPAYREHAKAPGSVARILRGGAFGNQRWHARCAYRFRSYPLPWLDQIGFRVVLSPSSSVSDL